MRKQWPCSSELRTRWTHFGALLLGAQCWSVGTRAVIAWSGTAAGSGRAPHMYRVTVCHALKALAPVFDAH